MSCPQLDGEQLFLDELIGDKTIEARRMELAEISRAAKDPANRVGGDGGQAPGAPAIVHGRGDRLESAAETVQRAGNPWRDAGGPLTLETPAGYVSRAHSAIEAVSRAAHPGRGGTSVDVAVVAAGPARGVGAPVGGGDPAGRRDDRGLVVAVL